MEYMVHSERRIAAARASRDSTKIHDLCEGTKIMWLLKVFKAGIRCQRNFTKSLPESESLFFFFFKCDFKEAPSAGQ